MTVIAWDGVTLAADTQADSAGISRNTTKIYKLADGRLFGGSGSTGQILEMKAWIESGANPDSFPPSQRDKDDWEPCVVISKNGIVRYERTPYPAIFHDKTFTDGSGRDFAAAAIHLGKTAKEAVQVAIELCTTCGGNIDTLDFE